MTAPFPFTSEHIEVIAEDVLDSCEQAFRLAIMLSHFGMPQDAFSHSIGEVLTCNTALYFEAVRYSTDPDLEGPEWIPDEFAGALMGVLSEKAQHRLDALNASFEEEVPHHDH